MADAISQILRNQIINLIREHGEIQIDLLIEYLWADETISAVYGFPEKMVRSALEELETANMVEWNKDDNVVSLKSILLQDDFDGLSKPRTIGKWEYTIIGRYFKLDDGKIDLGKIWKSLKETNIGLGEFRPHFSDNTKRIDISWTISGIECQCYWSEDSFYINSLMFEEPRREVLEYISSRPEPIHSFVLKAIPFSTAYLLYEYMKSVAGSIYPGLIFKLTKVRESSTKETI